MVNNSGINVYSTGTNIFDATFFWLNGRGYSAPHCQQLTSTQQEVWVLRDRFQCPCCLLAIDLWNSTRPPRPVSSSIQALPSLDANRANVGTQSLQQVVQSNTVWVCVGGWFPPSFSGTLSARHLFLVSSHHKVKKTYSLPCIFIPVHHISQMFDTEL